MYVFKFAIALGLCHYAAQAYDVGCLYPDTMPTPIQADFEIAEAISIGLVFGKVETPVVVRLAHARALCGANCMAAYDLQALNAITEARPAVFAPPQYHESFSRMLCLAQCSIIGNGATLGPVYEGWGLELSDQLEPEVVGAAIAAATDGGAALGQLLVARDFSPFVYGQLVALEIGQYFATDGWNSRGELVYDTETGEAVPCTANCQPYADPTGYFPRNHPDGKREPGNSKYVVRGKDELWQPLGEDDGRGFFTNQQHVTPHIGFTVDPWLLPDKFSYTSVPRPNYDYREEALLVIERMRETASDTVRKQKIQFFDNKLAVRAVIQDAAEKQLDLSFEEKMLFVYGISASEYDAILQSWNQKVRYDLVRPTTVIKRWGSDIINTWNGDPDSTGPADIAARDFEAFQRVMPHSEFPSASACLCTAYAEFTDAYSQARRSTFLEDIAVGGPDGFCCCEDAVGPFDPIQCGVNAIPNTIVFDNMHDLAYQCGQSRLWGGLHFTAAVPLAEQSCQGLGTLGFENVETIRAGTNWGGNEWREGDPRPVCGSK